MAMREQVTAHLWRLWDEAQQWELNDFSSGPIIVKLRKMDAHATPVACLHEAGKKEHCVKFRMNWDEQEGPHFVDITVGFQPDGDSHYFPYGGTRIITSNPVIRTEGDITWSEYRNVSLVNMPIRAFCQRELERACRHKKATKFFKFKQVGS